MKRTPTCLPRIRQRSWPRAIGLTATALASLATIAAAGGTASATPSHWESYHDEWSTDDSFCSRPGLTISEHGFADGRFRTTTRGGTGFSYDFDRGRFTDTWTNVATGEYVTQIASYRGGTHRIVDNGDGTLTVVVHYTRNIIIYNENGERIARENALFGFELLFDHAGTPTDPSDDVLLEYNVVKETGLNSDLCDTLVQALR